LQSRSDIWLGDALSVRRALSLDGEATLEMLRLLGLLPGDVFCQDRGAGADAETAEKALPQPPPAEGHAGRQPEAPAAPATSETASTLVHSVLERLETPAPSRTPPQWFSAQRPVARAFAVRTRSPQPLLGPLQRRSILSYAIGRDVAEGDLDIEAIARTLARGRVLTTLPRRPRRTLRYGVEVVVDRARWMEPFFGDQDGLIDYLETLLPTDRLHVRQISGRPLDSARQNKQRGARNRLHPHATILALTDLGVGYRAGVQAPPTAREWRQYAFQQRRADRALIVFMPYERARWPGSLRRSLAILHWSERTTVGQARRLRSGGRPDHPPRRREREQEHVRGLARVLSTSVRIDPWLLREARRALVPQSDAGTEADLWFSGLAASRGPAGLVLKPQLAAVLRSELAAMPEDFVAQAVRLIERAHAAYPEVTRIEEELGAMSLGRDPQEDRVDALLRPALKALHGQPKESNDVARPVDVARWAMHAWDRLPATVRQTDTARQLALAAALNVGDGAWISKTDPSRGLPTDAAWLLPESAGMHVGYGVELRQYADGEMELAVTVPYPLTTARHMIRVPSTQPALLEVRRTQGDDGLVQTLALVPGATLPLGAIDSGGAYDFALRTLRGDQYRLRTASAREVAEQCLVQITREPDSPSEPTVTGIYVGDRMVIAADVFEDRGVVYLYAQRAEGKLSAVVHRALAADAGWACLLTIDGEIEERRGSAHAPIDLDATLAGLTAGRTGSQMEREVSLFWYSGRELSVTHPAIAADGVDLRQGPQAAGGLLFDRNLPSGPAVLLAGAPPAGRGIQATSPQGSRDAGPTRLVPLIDVRDSARQQLRSGWRLIIWSADQRALEASLKSLLIEQMGPERVATVNPENQKEWESAAIASPALGRQMLSRNERVLPRVDALLLIGDAASSSYQIELAHAESIPILWLPVGDPEPMLASLPQHLATYLRTRQWLQLPANADAKALRQLAARIAQWQPYGEAVASEALPPSLQAIETPAAQRPTGSVRSRILDMLDNTEHATNLYHCPLLEPFALKPFVTPEGDAPILVVIHGDGSSGRGSFGSLWDASNERYRRRLHEHYGDRVLSFEYHSVTRGLLQNAIELARRLPAQATLDLLTIGGGGIVGELLCRVQREDASSPFDDEDVGLLREAGLREAVESARELASLLGDRHFRVRRFVRVACPVRGSVIWGELSAKALSWLKALGVIPWTLIDLLNVGVEHVLLGMLKNEQIAPGLTQLGPTSAIIRLVNRPNLRFAGELSIVAGIHDGSKGLKARLQEIAVRWVLKEGADFVVSLDSNFGGAARSGGVYRFVDSGPDVTHFNYFRNESSLERIVAALIEDGEHAGFERVALEADAQGRSSMRPLGLR
jgi:hypothetical protein